MGKNVFVNHIFNAPVEKVWSLWTCPELIKQWWGPFKFTCPVAEIDFRVGGTSKVCMVSKELGFSESYSVWQYKRIDLYSRIEYIQNLANKDGLKQNPVDLGMPPDFPTDVLTTITLKPIDNYRTEMTVLEDADFGEISHFAQLGMEQCVEKMSLILTTKINR
jgi:uncharacterized protein YndB with AHSA1/START domain